MADPRGLNPLLEATLRKDPKKIQIEAWLDGLQEERNRVPNAGIGVGPELETLIAMLRDPAGTALDTGLQVLDRKTRLTDSPSDVSMIPTRANLQKFLQLMKKSPITTNKIQHPAEAVAESYTAARYPKRYTRSSKNLDISPPRGNEFGVAGNFDPDTNNIRVMAKQSPFWSKLAKGGMAGVTETAVNTLAHESQHLLDATRKASPIKREEMRSKAKGGTYIPAVQRDPAGFSVANPAVYKNQPFEKRAFKAGDTAQRSYGKFLELLPGNKEDKMNQLFDILGIDLK